MSEAKTKQKCIIWGTGKAGSIPLLKEKELANTIEQLIKYYVSVDTNKVFSDIFSSL